MEKAWRLIIDGAREPDMNMALDEAIMLKMADGSSTPVLRIYRWLYPCVSIGKFQNFPVGEGSLPAVRRPTGGGSVCHNDLGITYSMVYRENSGVVAVGTAASYRQIHEAVAGALGELGLKVRLFSPSFAPARLPGACFSSPVESDVVSDGKKLAGAAQRRRFGVVLHQGEVSLSLDVWRKYSYNSILNSFITSLSKQLQARFIEGYLSEEECCLAEKLLMKQTEEVTA